MDNRESELSSMRGTNPEQNHRYDDKQEIERLASDILLFEKEPSGNEPDDDT